MPFYCVVITGSLSVALLFPSNSKNRTENLKLLNRQANTRYTAQNKILNMN